MCFTVNLDAVGNMPCNPAVGGTGKGHLVRELDALGGEMARAADKACIQYRMLNRGKGPAVWSLRAQADRRRYQQVMKHALEKQDNLWVKQAEVTDILTEKGRVSAVRTATGAVYRVKAAVAATGTHLGGRTIVGEVSRSSGPRRPGRRQRPDGQPAGPGGVPAAVQDGHAPPHPRPQRGLLPAGAPAGGRRSPALLLRDGAGPGQPGGVLAHLDQ